MKKTNVAVFFGGKTVEHDVSIVTALQLMENLDKEKYNIIPIYITRDGDWYTGEKLMQVDTFKNFKADSQMERCYLPANARAGMLFRFNAKGGLFKKQSPIICKIDVAIPAMHGLHGEDGTLQGLLELADIPYTSCGVLGSSVGMDKILMKAAFKGAALPCVPYYHFDRNDYKENSDNILDSAEAQLSYPMFVKPANLGSSIGISKAKNREELAKAIEVASYYDRRILVEQAVPNLMEINCSGMGFGNDVQASVCEMPVSWEDFLTYEEKYLRSGKGGKGGNKQGAGMASLSRQIPAPISDELTAQIQEYTVKIFKLLDCKGVVRIDYLYNKETNELFVNEINTIPGSFAYYLWEPLGLTYSQLLDKLVHHALKANEESKASEYAFNSEILSKYKQNGKLAGFKK